MQIWFIYLAEKFIKAIFGSCWEQQPHTNDNMVIFEASLKANNTALNDLKITICLVKSEDSV